MSCNTLNYTIDDISKAETNQKQVLAQVRILMSSASFIKITHCEIFNMFLTAIINNYDW